MSDIALHDASDLAATVQRARALLDEGDVAAARLLAGGVYDQAKAAAGYAARVGAGRQLVDKARRLQGDALLIEARAKIWLAKDWDAAQAAGEAKSKGRPKNVDGDRQYSAEDVGLTRDQIHEARKLADAERRAPGIVERAIAARLEAGLEPSRANLRAAVGTASATKEERGHNLYETPIEAMRTLLALMGFSPDVWEPSCGRCAIVRPLEAAGYDVYLSDLIDYGAASGEGECQAVCDFLATTRDADSAIGPDETLRIFGRPDIVTNPPYGADLNRFVAHALRVHRPRRMALLLNLNFMCGFDDPERRFAMDECPPARIYVFTRRLPMMHRDGWDGPEASSRMNTAWFVWELRGDSYAGPTELIRVDWQDFEAAQPLAPLAQETAPAAPSPVAATGLLSWHPARAGSRILAKLGTIEVGAVWAEEKGATWSFWLDAPSGAAKVNRARTVDAAKAALAKVFAAKTGLPA